MTKAKRSYDVMYPLGVTQTAEGVEILMPYEGETMELLLFHAGEQDPFERLPFNKEDRIGEVWIMSLSGYDLSGLEYSFLADGRPFADPYARSVTGREQWGELRVRPVRAHIPSDPFDWQGDKNPEIPYSETILYRLHVRGFTKTENSGVKHHGTFAGLAEKIPYLKDLGVTAVELMPVTEFDEVLTKTSVREGAVTGHVGTKEEPTGKINYWGYGPSFLYALKASYGTGKQPVETEFKALVKALHKEHMECILELFFTGGETPRQFLDVLRYWVREYHVDGFRLSGTFPAETAAADPFLRRTKLFAEHWGREKSAETKPARAQNTESGPVPVRTKNLAVYRGGFQNVMRRFLNGGDRVMEQVMEQIGENPDLYGAVHYMANTDGFTMMDMVSYNEKNNWDNGEDNEDGTDFNESWNCGGEGPTENEKILKLRKQQLKNGFMLLLLSQGTPLILAGDEFGNSQNGNNNAYCQDNETGWIDWGLLEKNRDLCEFVKEMIRFRKAHKMFHMDHAAKRADYRSLGCPDVSFHGESAWKTDTAPFRRQLGVLYWGPYWTKFDGTPEDSYYVAYNMHFGTHRLGLPRLPVGYSWKTEYSTSEFPAEVRGKIQAIIPPRAVVVFKAVGESGSETYSTPVGDMTIVCRGGWITEIGFGRRDPADTDVGTQETPELIKLAYRQLMEYFDGERKEFHLPLKPEGTEFQKKVWTALREIPYGETRSYGQIAARIGDPKASRAVGMANNKNPLAIVVPCHRVVGANGSLTGYAGGLDVKETLLHLENAHK